MIEADIPIIRRIVPQLIREIDDRYARYSRNIFGDIEELDTLETLLEEQLEILEAALSEIEDESGSEDQDLEPEACEGCSIEEQFRAAYARHLTDPLHSMDTLECFPAADLAGHLRSILEDSQVGGMNPSGFRGADDAVLIELARDLFQEHRSRIASLQLPYFSANCDVSQ